MIAKKIEKRPWGRFYVIHDEPLYKLKRIEVDPGQQFLINTITKDQVWTIIDGEGFITLDGKENKYSKGETVLIPKGIKHRIENKGLEKIIFIEVQTGSYFGEDDIVRIEDDYNRI